MMIEKKKIDPADYETLAWGIVLLLLLCGLVFGLFWMFGVDRAGTIAWIAGAGGIATAVATIVSSSLYRRK